MCKSIPPEVFSLKRFLKNFAKFTGNTCVRVFSLVKLQEAPQVFFSEFREICKNAYFAEHLRTAASLCIVKWTNYQIFFSQVLSNIPEYLFCRTHINIVFREEHFPFYIPEMYSEPSQASKVEPFVKIVNSWNLIPFARSTTLDVRLSPE